MHKKTCARPVSTPAATSTSSNPDQSKGEIDQAEIAEQIQKIIPH